MLRIQVSHILQTIHFDLIFKMLIIRLELCHDHSEIPESWPPLYEVLQFQDAVREKTKDLYASGASQKPRVAKALWLAFEHEAMHLETLLYMLIQSDRILPPPDTVVPDFEALSHRSKALTVENQWFTVPEATITLGLDDLDDPTGARRYFGWDNEKPSRSVHVGSFQAKARPITNGEYAEYLNKTGQTTIPASWCDIDDLKTNGHESGKRDSVVNGINGHTNGAVPAHEIIDGKYVRTVYGAVLLKYVLDWPVVASYNELAGCAQWMGGRIPTLEEARSIYSFVDHSKRKECDQALGKTIPAVNGYVHVLD